MAFARTLISAGSSTRVGFVATGMGATSLEGDWAKSKNNLYQRMITATQNAMNTAISTWGSANVKLRGMLWVQVCVCVFCVLSGPAPTPFRLPVLLSCRIVSEQVCKLQPPDHFPFFLGCRGRATAGPGPST